MGRSEIYEKDEIPGILQGVSLFYNFPVVYFPLSGRGGGRRRVGIFYLEEIVKIKIEIKGVGILILIFHLPPYLYVDRFFLLPPNTFFSLF